ncbi:hypothetical protein J5500_04530 [Candidatus Saccharibacteria bacterium]|nr:hypothetical protein [Candidatus Saccharibacteria bacterium]
MGRCRNIRNTVNYDRRPKVTNYVPQYYRPNDDLEFWEGMVYRHNVPKTTRLAAKAILIAMGAMVFLTMIAATFTP